MTMKLIYEAAERALLLVRGLEQSDRESDRHQVASGVHYELTAIRTMALQELQRLQEAATGDREGKVRADAPATSRAAARGITLKTGSARAQILLRLWRLQEQQGWVARYGCTDLDLQENLDMNPSTERPRRGELVDAGLVERIGERPLAGTQWTVWGITQLGADAASEALGLPHRTVAVSAQPSLF